MVCCFGAPDEFLRNRTDNIVRRACNKAFTGDRDEGRTCNLASDTLDGHGTSSQLRSVQ